MSLLTSTRYLAGSYPIIDTLPTSHYRCVRAVRPGRVSSRGPHTLGLAQGSTLTLALSYQDAAKTYQPATFDGPEPGPKSGPDADGDDGHPPAARHSSLDGKQVRCSGW